MAKSGETFFINSALSRILSQTTGDSALHDAFAVTMAFASRTSQNTVLVSLLLLAKTKEVLRRNSYHFAEYLCNAQALLVLYILMLFEDSGSGSALGDQDHALDLGRAADASFDAVRNRIMTLLQRGEDEIAIPQKLPRSTTKENSCLRLLFLESVRRTYLMFIFLEAVYVNLRKGYCELVPLLVTLSISLEGNLWNAQSEVGWASLAEAGKRKGLAEEGGWR
ncbi:hypothetical protein GJ744_002775 [Endocarpon pusillum]|uniref:Uncharacterized protein n=1 Tax=Endocarpon pusillum TaxID=364733 RepID=A0A8H7ASB4_9EURO|nr:hypothetical protein GJ744_002775 [Endocarpon pusillum]